MLFESPEKLDEAVEGVRRFIPLVRLWGEPPTLLERAIGPTPTPTDRFLSGLAIIKVDAETEQFVELLARTWTQTLDDPAGNVHVPNLAQFDASDAGRLGYY